MQIVIVYVILVSHWLTIPCCKSTGIPPDQKTLTSKGHLIHTLQSLRWFMHPTWKMCFFLGSLGDYEGAKSVHSSSNKLLSRSDCHNRVCSQQLIVAISHDVSSSAKIGGGPLQKLQTQIVLIRNGEVPGECSLKCSVVCMCSARITFCSPIAWWGKQWIRTGDPVEIVGLPTEKGCSGAGKGQFPLRLSGVIRAIGNSSDSCELA